MRCRFLSNIFQMISSRHVTLALRWTHLPVSNIFQMISSRHVTLALRWTHPPVSNIFQMISSRHLTLALRWTHLPVLQIRKITFTLLPLITITECEPSQNSGLVLNSSTSTIVFTILSAIKVHHQFGSFSHHSSLYQGSKCKHWILRQ